MNSSGLLEFHPVLKRIRWGGRRLGSVLGKPIGDDNDYAESWEVSCHEHGLSVVHGGRFDGWTLKQLVEQYPDDILGRHRGSSEFPLLVKFLDASDRLSVQVHPDDQTAATFEPGGVGKTETWVVLDAEPDSRLYVGLNADVDADRLRASLADDTVEDCLHSFPVQAGTCVFIPAGTVHAIGEGILLAEIQQSSDITFRLYDWGRLDSDGTPRPLHIEEALACIDFERGPVNPIEPNVVSRSNPRTEILVESAYFTTRRHRLRNPFTLDVGGTFHVLMTLSGSGRMTAGDEERQVTAGRTVLVPACCPEVTITCGGHEELVLLEAFMPR